MIKLEVKDYCQNCPGFVAETDAVRVSVDGHYEYTTTVWCKYAARCANIARYLEKEIERKHADKQQFECELED